MTGRELIERIRQIVNDAAEQEPWKSRISALETSGAIEEGEARDHVVGNVVTALYYRAKNAGTKAVDNEEDTTKTPDQQLIADMKEALAPQVIGMKSCDTLKEGGEPPLR